MVSEGTIRARYQTIVPFYELWHETYGNSVMDNVYFDTPVFPDVQTRVAWEVAGYLIACWFVMQDEVTAVEYTFADDEVDGEQLITRENMAEAIVEFLEFEMAVLGGTAGDTFTSRLL